MKSICLSLLISCCLLNAAFAQPDADKLRAHITYLASDALQGRGTGTNGEKLAANYIGQELKKIGLKPLGDNKTFLQAFEFKGGIHGTEPGGMSANVVAFLDNKAQTTIVVGAHYDHLGFGLKGASFAANDSDSIYNGADDNASGVAGVLELARYFTTNKVKEKNNFLFILFSGEELGLYGSGYFVDHPTVPLEQMNFMINLDMVGRLDPKKGLVVNGTGTAPEWEPLLKSLQTDAMPIKTDSSGTGPSDHTKFNNKNIPVLHFFTDSHSDYHKTTDAVEKINFDGEVTVLQTVIKVIEAMDSKPKLTFLKTKSKDTGTKVSLKVTLGITPCYSCKVTGLQLDGVSQGKPAEKAGMMAGDIIIQMGDLVVKDILTYMDALGKCEKGTTVPIKVLRDNKEVIIPVTF